MSDESTCDVCGEEFKNSHGVAMHKAQSHDNPWQDEENLRERYVENEESSEQMARDWGCDPKTVRNYLEKYGIDRRSPGFYQKKLSATYNTDERGYCTWWDTTRPTRVVSVHRLLAVSEFGFDALRNKHVHHKNGVKWDNRPENLELKSPSEHIKHHQERGEIPYGPEAQKRGGYDPRGLFKGIPNEDRYEGMYKELMNKP